MLTHVIAHGGCTDTAREFAPKGDSGEKNPLPHQGIEPASAACRSDTLPTELHPHTEKGQYAEKDSEDLCLCVNIDAPSLMRSFFL